MMSLSLFFHSSRWRIVSSTVVHLPCVLCTACGAICLDLSLQFPVAILQTQRSKLEGIHVSDEGSVVKMTLVIAGILDWAVLFSRAWLKVIAGAVSAFIGRAIFRPIIRAVMLGRLFFLYEKSVAGIALSNSKLNNQNAFGSTPLLHHKAIHCFVFCSL